MQLIKGLYLQAFFIFFSEKKGLRDADLDVLLSLMYEHSYLAVLFQVISKSCRSYPF